MKSSGRTEECRQAAEACRPMACSFCLPVESISSFYPLLAQGFFIPIHSGCSVKEFLCGHLGWEMEFVQQRVQTIFMEGRLVDDIDRTLVQDGASILFDKGIIIVGLLCRGETIALC